MVLVNCYHKRGFYWKVNATMQRKTSMTFIHILRLIWSRGLFWLGWDEPHTNVLITMGGAAREGGKSGTEVKKISLLQVGLHFHLFTSICLRGARCRYLWCGFEYIYKTWLGPAQSLGMLCMILFIWLMSMRVKLSKWNRCIARGIVRMFERCWKYFHYNCQVSWYPPPPSWLILPHWNTDNYSL